MMPSGPTSALVTAIVTTNPATEARTGSTVLWVA